MDESILREQLNKLDALRSSLHSSFRFWDWVVVAGVALEFIVLGVEYWDEWQAFLRARIAPEKPKTWLFVIGFCGIALVAGGIVKELQIDSQIEGVETQVRNANEKLFGMVSKKAEDASNKADAVSKRADEIGTRIETASAKMGVLEDRIASLGARWISLAAHKKDFIKSMARFNGQKVFLVSCGLSGGERDEADELERYLTNFLGEFDESQRDGAGWIVDDSKSAKPEQCNLILEGDPHVAAGGIVLVVSNTTREGARRSAVDAAKALKNELNNKVKIKTRIAPDRKLDTAAILIGDSFWEWARDTLNDPKAIVLLVGPNPR